MKLIMFEGQPGSGKTTIGEKIFVEMKGEKKSAIIDEYAQDTVLFGDYWEEYDADFREKTVSFESSWDKLLDNPKNYEFLVSDNMFMNQVRYLMALNAPEQNIEEYFMTVAGKLSETDIIMVFLTGDPDVVIRRVDRARTNGWGKRVSELFEKMPYQAKRQREGINGLVEFFHDADIFSKRLLESWPYPRVTIDVTKEDWTAHRQAAEIFLAAHSGG